MLLICLIQISVRYFNIHIQIAIHICKIGNTMKLLQSGNMKGDTHRSVSPTQIYCRATF